MESQGGADPEAAGVTRRRFLGYLIAGPTLIAAAPLARTSAAFAAEEAAPIPTAQLVDHYDLTDLLTDATRPFSHLITVEVNPDGTVSFALHRAEVGQGITTAVAMTIADEMDIPLDKVHVTLADARPELGRTSSPAGRTRCTPSSRRSAWRRRSREAGS